MEAKDEGETVKIYVISDDAYVTILVLISSESDETTFIASDCEAIFVSLLRKRRHTDIMADNRKEVERAELHRTIWAIADQMRGSVDGWDFKSYILGMLFYRYISENITTYINKGEWETGNTGFDYAELDDARAEDIRAEMVNVKGFFILPSQLFQNICKSCVPDAESRHGK